jgi:hypothetical protein
MFIYFHENFLIVIKNHGFENFQITLLKDDVIMFQYSAILPKMLLNIG